MTDEYVGRLIDGRYVVESLLGSGGMGVVLRARHQFTGASVALKMLRSHLQLNEDVKARFLAEARAPSSIGHRGIVQVLDAGRTAEGELYLAMELLDGVSLRDVVRAGLPGPEIKRIIIELLDALAAAHGRGVVHRDLKPENVFLAGPTRSVKLLDFGIAKIVAGDTSNLNRTSAGDLLGTLAYMAPEQIRDASAVDPRADLWAVGVMVYEMLAGRLPYRPTDLHGLFVAISTQDPDPIGAYVPNVAPAISAFFARALARDPAQRFANATEMATALATLPLDRAAPPRQATAAASTRDQWTSQPVPAVGGGPQAHFSSAVSGVAATVGTANPAGFTPAPGTSGVVGPAEPGTGTPPAGFAAGPASFAAPGSPATPGPPGAAAGPRGSAAPGSPASAAPGAMPGTPGSAQVGFAQAGFAPGSPAGSAHGAPSGFASGSPAGSAHGAPSGFAPGSPAGSAHGAPSGFAPGAPVGPIGSMSGSAPGIAGSAPGSYAPAGSSPTAAPSSAPGVAGPMMSTSAGGSGGRSHWPLVVLGTAAIIGISIVVIAMRFGGSGSSSNIVTTTTTVGSSAPGSGVVVKPDPWDTKAVEDPWNKSGPPSPPPPAPTPPPPPVVKPPVPQVTPAQLCIAHCNNLGGCGLANAECRSLCGANTRFAQCLAAVTTLDANTCNRADSCLFLPLCGAVPTGTWSCAQTAGCQGSCAPGDIACGCRCMVNLAPSHAAALAPLDACATACKFNSACIQANCSMFGQACLAQ